MGYIHDVSSLLERFTLRTCGCLKLNSDVSNILLISYMKTSKNGATDSAVAESRRIRFPVSPVPHLDLKLLLPLPSDESNTRQNPYSSWSLISISYVFSSQAISNLRHARASVFAVVGPERVVVSSPHDFLSLKSVNLRMVSCKEDEESSKE